MGNQPNSQTIIKIGMGFIPSKILLAAIEFDLFTIIAKKEKISGLELKTALELKCSDRHFYDFLDSLVALGFLSREGILDNAQYYNARDTDAFLDKGKDTYVGGFLQMANKRIYEVWGRFQEGLRTGSPQNQTRNGGGKIYDLLYSSPDMMKIFMKAMGDYQNFAFQDFVGKFDMTSYKSLLDVGGAGANLSIAIAKQNPQLECLTFDLPPILPLAQQNIEKHSLSSRIKAITGDFFKDQLPKADVVVMGNILHIWDQKEKEYLIKQAYEAVNEGGIFVVIEDIIDNERSKQLPALEMSLLMLLETKGGFNFAFDEYSVWVKSAGFKKTEIIGLVGGKSAAIAYK